MVLSWLKKSTLPCFPQDEFFLGKCFEAMEVDSLSSSHPVSTPVENPTQIQEMFDDVSYDKVSPVCQVYWLYAFFFIVFIVQTDLTKFNYYKISIIQKTLFARRGNSPLSRPSLGGLLLNIFLFKKKYILKSELAFRLVYYMYANLPHCFSYCCCFF